MTDYKEIKDYLEIAKQYRHEGDAEGARQALGLARFLLDSVPEQLKLNLEKKENEEVEAKYTQTRLILKRSPLRKVI